MDPVTLQNILDALAGDADALAAVLARDDVDLAALEAEALETFDAIRARQADGLTAEDVAALEQLADGVTAIRGEAARREQVAAEQAAAVDAIAARIAPGPAGEDAQDEAGENDAAGGQDDAAAAEENSPGGEGVPAAVEQTPEPVLAAGRPPARPPVNLANIARRSRKPAPPAPTASSAALLAAADVPGMGSGAQYAGMDQLVEATVRRLQSLPSATSNFRGRMQQGLLVLRKDVDESLVASGQDDQEVLDHAASEARLAGGSLTAAGGWCAPSETWYDIACERETLEGLVSVPEVVAARGGVRWTQGPDFSAIYTQTGFVQTEAQAEAGDVKPCFEVPCDDFLECRLDAVGVCLTAGILQNRAYPELVARWIRGTLTAHAHRYAALTLARMVAGSTPVTLPATPFSATVDVLAALDLQAIDYRTRHRMSPNASLEVVAPVWLRGVLRSDWSKRNGCCDLDVADASIQRWFSDRGLAVQWVYNWQDAYAPTVVPIGGATPPTAWPATVQILLYAAGTWVRATQDIITVDTLYDSTLMSTNRYQALFSEDGLCVIQRCPDSRVLTIPICPTGATGAHVAVTCPTV